MGEVWKKGIAELIGTFAWIFIGAGSVIVNNYSDGEVGLVGIALAHGLTVAVMVSCIGHISGGHMNPAVTAGFLVARRMTVNDGAVYVVSQLVGGALAGFFLKALYPVAAVEVTHLGTPALASGIGYGAGMVIELILTFFLVFTVFATAVDDKGAFKTIAGFGIGLVVAFDILAGFPLTGASMNPARTFGPALAVGFWKGHLVYWIGPILGGIIAALVYDNTLMEKKAR